MAVAEYLYPFAIACDHLFLGCRVGIGPVGFYTGIVPIAAGFTVAVLIALVSVDGYGGYQLAGHGLAGTLGG